MAEPVFIVTSVTTTSKLEQKPRTSPDQPIEYDNKMIYNITMNLQYADDPSKQGPGFGFTADGPDIWPLGSKYKLTPL